MGTELKAEGDASQAKTLERAYGTAFEKLVTWLLLFDADFAALLCTTLTPEVFERESYCTIFETAQALFEKHKMAVGYVSVRAEILNTLRASKEKSATREKMIQAMRRIKLLKSHKPAAGDIEYVKTSIATFLTKARVRDALIQCGELWEAGRFDEVLETVEDAVRSKERSLDQDEGINFNDTMSKLKLYTYREKHVNRAALDIPLLDRKLRGGIEPGNLGVVLAPAKRGKSLFLVHAGVAALSRGLNVAVVSLELRRHDYMARFDGRLTGIPINEITLHPLKHAKVLMRKTNALKGNLFIQHYGSNTATVSDIYVWLKVLESRHKFKPDVLIVDYVDLLRTSHTRGDRPDIGDLCKALRQVGEDFDCVVWTASQSRRSSFNQKFIELQDVAEDIQKIQVADVVIGIAQTKGELAHNKARLLLLANRQGGEAGSIIDVTVQTETMMISQARVQATAIKRTAGL